MISEGTPSLKRSPRIAFVPFSVRAPYSMQNADATFSQQAAHRAGIPAAKVLSLTDTGIPSRGLRRVPDAWRAVASLSTWVKAFSTGSNASSPASDWSSSCSHMMSRASGSADNEVTSSCQVMRLSPEL